MRVRQRVSLIAVSVVVGISAAVTGAATPAIATPAAAATVVTVDSLSGLQAAFANVADNGDTIALGQSISDTSGDTGVVEPDNESLTLDLAGFSLSLTNLSDSDAAINVPLSASLTITDSADGGTLTATGGAGIPAGQGGGAGIGGQGGTASGPSSFGGSAGSVTIDRAVVIATGGDGSGATTGADVGMAGAGIGGGGADIAAGGTSGDGAALTITAGSVTAAAGAQFGGIPADATGGGGGGIPASAGANDQPLDNAGSLTLKTAERVASGSVTNEPGGTITVDGALTGGGTIVNDGSIVLGPSGSVDGNGDGDGSSALAVTGHHYAVSFDGSGSPDASPATQTVYAATYDGGGEGLPDAVTPPGAAPFAGWFTAASGGSPVDDASDLSALPGASASCAPSCAITLYAHYSNTVDSWNALTAAFAGVGSGDSATFGLGQALTRPTNPSRELAVPSGADITLDLNGQSLTIGPDAAHAGLQPLPEGVPGVGVPSDASLTVIDSSAHASGLLTTTGGGSSSGEGGGAGIGGSGGPATESPSAGTSSGSVTLHGAAVTATGGTGSDNAGAGGGAGIGGGGSGEGVAGSSGGGAGPVTINAATVDATGGDASFGGGAGIGGGGAGYSLGESTGGDGGALVVTGGQVTAAGGPSTSHQTSESGDAVGEGGHGGSGTTAEGAFGSVDNTGALTFTSAETVPATVTAGASTTSFFTNESDGTVTVGAPLSGAGTIDNLGVISTTGAGSIADTLHSGTLTVDANAYVLSFDKGAGSWSGSTPTPLDVYASDVSDSGQQLPAPTPPAGRVFTGWNTSSSGTGATVTAATHLATALGTGPKAATLYARYGPSPVTLHVRSTHSKATYGQRVVAQATVTSAVGTPAGTVQFSVDGHKLGEPIAVKAHTARSKALTLHSGAPLAATSHLIAAVFTPKNAVIQTSAQGTTYLVIGRAPTKARLVVAGKTLTAKVVRVTAGAAKPTGHVTFSVDGKRIGTARLSHGAATLKHTTSAGQSHHVAVVYNGSHDYTGSSVSTARRDPRITARVTSKHHRSRFGWYRSTVTIRFHCRTSGAPLVGHCPRPVTLRHKGASQAVTRTVLTSDGGSATAVVSPVNIDKTRPKVRVTGVKSGATYTATAPAARCVATDSLSGVASCRITKHTTTSATTARTTYTATATDRAGNIRTIKGQYTTRLTSRERE